MTTRVAVVLFNLGGPDRPEAIEPFLFNLFNDPAIIGLPTPLRWPLARLLARRRAKVAREIYAHLGGRSPLLKLTTAGIVKCLHKIRVTGEAFWCRHILNTVLFPQPVRSTEGSNTGLGRDPRPGQHHHSGFIHRFWHHSVSEKDPLAQALTQAAFVFAKTAESTLATRQHRNLVN